MSDRARRLAWLLASLSVLGILGWCFARFVLGAPALGFSFAHGGDRYRLSEPRALGVLLLAPVLLYAVGRSLSDLPLAQRLLSFALRVSFLALLALGLARLVRSEESHRIATVALLDVSDSVADATLNAARADVERLLAHKGPDDVVKVVTFAARARAVGLDPKQPLSLPPLAALRFPETKAKIAGVPAETAVTRSAAGSNLAGALQLSYALFPPGYLKRIVLYSDGLETEGNLLAEANHARGLGARLHVRPYRDPPPGEVAVRALRLPDKVDVGQPFDVTAEIYSSRGTRAKARLYQGETLNGLDGVRELTLEPGVHEVKFKSVVRLGGEVTYALKLSEIADDHFAENNSFETTLDVPGRPSVLYVEGQPPRGSYLANALSAQQFDVDLRAPSAMPTSLRELERYDFFVLSDVPAEAVSEGSQDLIEKYVRDLGGGFLFAGGEAGYGLGGWQHTTVERLLPVRMDAERQKEMPAVAMALIVDRSGSMSGQPLELAKAACKATVATLQADDMIEVIAFDAAPTRYVKMQSAGARARINGAISRIEASGGTEIAPALDWGYQDLSVVQARRKHAILLTDGQSASRGMRELARAMLAESITVTTVGLGEGVDQELLRAVADAGGGRFHYVPDPNSLPKIFTKETELIQRQAGVEEWFPVQQVGSADFLKGLAIGSAPLLHGYVATQLKPAPAQLILQSERGEPILARWRSGLGWALAWTSDVKNNWSVDWLRWSGFPKFWGQLVREHMRVKRRKELPMRLEVDGDVVHAVVDAFTADERFDNDLESKLSITGPGAKGERREMPMRRTAPGRYEAALRLTGNGSFLVRAEHSRVAADGSSQPFASSFGHVSSPYPREYARFEPDLDLLTRAASAASGVVDATDSQVFAADGETVTFYRPLWSRFVFAAIIVFLLDLLVRRVRLFDRKFSSAPRAPR